VPKKTQMSASIVVESVTFRDHHLTFVVRGARQSLEQICLSILGRDNVPIVERLAIPEQCDLCGFELMSCNSDVDLGSDLSYRIFIDVRKLGGPLKEVRFTPVRDGMEVQIEGFPSSGLASLFFDDAAEFDRARFARDRKRRPADPSIQLFMAKQVLENFHGPGYVPANMALVYAYRSVELGSLINCENAARFLEDQVKEVDCLGESVDYKKDGLHILVSLLTAQWHVALFLKDKEAFLAALHKIDEISRSDVPTRSVFLLSYNVIRSLSTLCAYYFCNGSVQRGRDIMSNIRDFTQLAAMKLRWEVSLLEFARTCKLVGDIGREEMRVAKMEAREVNDGSRRKIVQSFLVPALRTSNTDVMATNFLEIMFSGSPDGATQSVC
jgi:hypothetical protein